MITKEQAINLTHGQEIHVEPCTRTTGPRGGVKYSIETWRVNGKCKVWVTRPDEFQVPLKWGLKTHGILSHANARTMHRACDCMIR